MPYGLLEQLKPPPKEFLKAASTNLEKKKKEQKQIKNKKNSLDRRESLDSCLELFAQG